jgi:hypothetical protein
MARGLAAWLIVLSTCGAAAAHAQTTVETPLLELNTRDGKTRRIDASSDADFDAALTRALGSGDHSFTTRELDATLNRLVDELKRNRPRASPQLIVFLYPGRVSPERLKTLSEVTVDVELVVDPCDRSVCDDAIATEIELVGRAVQHQTVQLSRVKLVYGTLIVRALVSTHDADNRELRLPMARVIQAGARPGGGHAMLAELAHSADAFEPLVAKAIVRQAQLRRVELARPPQIARSGGSAQVALHIHGDRSRVEQQVLDALAAATLALRQNPTTPAETTIDVAVDIASRGQATRRFQAPATQVGLYLDGKLSVQSLLSTYVHEAPAAKDATVLSFSDADTHSANPDGEGASDADAVAVLSANMAKLAPCVRAEAERDPRFGGVTLVVRWMQDGHVPSATVKGAAPHGELARCLDNAARGIALPRFSGAPRTIEFPIQLRR